jgi:membrane protein DedA with SNARE-associated domain
MDIIDIVTKVALQGKYFWLFIIYLVEGPISGFVTAVIASTGQLNIFVIGLLLISGEIGADLIYYFIGKNLSESKINKKLKKYEKKGFINAIKEVLDKHPVRALAFAKSVAFIAVPTIILLGRYKSMKFPKFLLWTTLICLIKDLTVLFLGYGLGISLDTFLGGYNIYKIVGIILALIAIGYIIFRANKTKIENFVVNSLKNIR